LEQAHFFLASFFLRKEPPLEKLKRRIKHLKEKRPGYGRILDLYLKFREEQEKVRSSVRIEPVLISKEWKDLLTKEGFPLIQKEDFPIDVAVSDMLLQSLCRVAEKTNPFMAGETRKIKEMIEGKRFDFKEMLKTGGMEKRLEQRADELGLDKKFFLFLIYNSIKPSIEAGREYLAGELPSETETRRLCPICGSGPILGLLREEAGKRYLLCSYCAYPWRTDRVACPFCDNREPELLQYVYGEGEETSRVDLCEKCHQYIKTIDLRRIEEGDPFLEDLATPHLDIIASRKGYKRPIPNPWVT